MSLDLPKIQESATDMFERIRREIPEFERIRPFDGEVALETAEVEGRYQWVGLRPTSIASGFVNPNHIEAAYNLHRLVLDLSPYYLSLTPLHIEYIELVYGFDLPARENRNNVVAQSLLANTPLASLADESMEPLLDVQPRIGFALNEACDLQAFVEIKTRTTAVEAATQVFENEPISVFLTIRKNGPIQALEELESTFSRLAGHIEHIAEHRVVPDIVVPLHQAIGI
ncbi:MAG TPA: hypothetical protein EYO01_03535 [Phycisphaerales bacterium]|nr:hypothetical protein [Phycisphaerales bacterium]HIB02171.1 hypothetical protein [Phycisphaerales bacterium]